MSRGGPGEKGASARKPGGRARGGGSGKGRRLLRDLGFLALRLAFGWSLIQDSYAELFDAGAMNGFGGYLRGLGIPFPLAAAYLCKGTELAGGIALIAGAWVRPVSVALVVNFLVVVFLAKRGQPWEELRDGVEMLGVSIFFLCNGAGGLSVDRLLRRVEG